MTGEQNLDKINVSYLQESFMLWHVIRRQKHISETSH